MSDDSDEDLPGTIHQRQVITQADVSDDDLDDAGVFLAKGQARKAALEEQQRKREEAKREEEARKAAADAAKAADAAAKAEAAAAAAKPAGRGGKRPRRGKAAAAAAAAASAASADGVVELDDDDLDETDAQLLKKTAEQQARLRQTRAEFASLQDDLDDASPAAAAPSARRHRPAPSALWLVVRAEDASAAPLAPFRCSLDEPLSSSLVGRVATQAGLLAERVVLYAGGAKGTRLDLGATPRALGLTDKQELLAKEERPQVETVKLHLSYQARPKVVLSHPVDAPLSELLAAFCAAAHPPGSLPPPKRLQISFDGDRVDGKKTPRQLELEEDDLLEVVDAR